MRYNEAMGEALRLAHEAAAEGEVPVGALVLDDKGAVIGRGRNRRERQADPLAHAEVEALREAARTRLSLKGHEGGRAAAWNLSDCSLVVTLEPCPMCAGAAVQAHVGAIVFGAWDAKQGACGSVWDIPRDPHVGHYAQVFAGVQEAACAAVLEHFFQSRRP